jgi:Nucleoside diphosphate kinase
MERTLVLIKPDGVERKLVGKIISIYEERNLNIATLKMLHTDRETAEAHYAEHKGRPYFDELINYMLEDKICVMIIEGENAIEIVRKINGDKDPLKVDMGSIRGKFSNEKSRNLVHSSDSAENAEREIKIWFSDYV